MNALNLKIGDTFFDVPSRVEDDPIGKWKLVAYHKSNSNLGKMELIESNHPLFKVGFSDFLRMDQMIPSEYPSKLHKDISDMMKKMGY